MGKRSEVLELAILGLLHESPMHGYELRKRLNAVLGSFRAFSYGSLYPCLKGLLLRRWITEDGPADAGAPALSGKRSRIVYKLTAEGKERFQELLSQSGPSAWEDENFGVHFAFFAKTTAEVRMRILEGRRSRLEERLERVRASLARTRERLDAYTLELQHHGLESVEREVRWLNELIANEQGTGGRPGAAARPTRPLLEPDAGREAGGHAGEPTATLSVRWHGTEHEVGSARRDDRRGEGGTGVGPHHSPDET